MSQTILIVNGSAGRRQINRQLLERAGYEVREIVALDRALSEARRTLPLAVVVEAPEDAELPARFSELLRRHPVTRDVPVVVLTSDADLARERERDEVVGVSWLSEPCSSRSLLEEIAYLTRPPIAHGIAFSASRSGDS